MRRARSFVLLFLCGLAGSLLGADLERREWTVDGVVREALFYVPPQAQSNAVPVVFVFHGHGGTMRNAARSFSIHTLWPEALVIYMQGLPIPGVLTDPEGKKAGWQPVAGAVGDRDLKFVDAVMDTLRTGYKIDGKHVFATGHSNGGGFTYLLWGARPYVFDAFAPCAAATSQFGRLTPRPVLHLAGEKDRLVKYEWQQRTMEGLRRQNKCAAAGEPWDKCCTRYASPVGAPVVTYIHPGGHELPADAPAAIVRFFKEQMAAPAPK